MDSGLADSGSGYNIQAATGEVGSSRRGIPAAGTQGGTQGGVADGVESDIEMAEFCARIVQSSTDTEMHAATQVAVAALSRRGFSLSYDVAVALAVRRHYSGLPAEQVILLLSSLSTLAEAARFLERMARDSLEIIPMTPSSAGTVWRQPLPAEAPVLQSVSRAMGECTWDLTDTIAIAPASIGMDSSPSHQIIYTNPARQQAPMHNDGTTRQSTANFISFSPVASFASSGGAPGAPVISAHTTTSTSRIPSPSRDPLGPDSSESQTASNAVCGNAAFYVAAPSVGPRGSTLIHQVPPSTPYPPQIDLHNTLTPGPQLQRAAAAASIVGDTMAQLPNLSPPEVMETCLRQHVRVSPTGPGAQDGADSSSADNDRAIDAASEAARAFDGLGELSYYTESYGKLLQRLLPGVHLTPFLATFVECAPKALRFMDTSAYYETIKDTLQAAPLADREANAAILPTEVAESAAAHADSQIKMQSGSTAATPISSRGLGAGPPPRTSPGSRDDFRAALARGQQAAEDASVEQQRRQVHERAQLLEQREAAIKEEALQYARAQQARGTGRGDAFEYPPAQNMGAFDCRPCAPASGSYMGDTTSAFRLPPFTPHGGGASAAFQSPPYSSGSSGKGVGSGKGRGPSAPPTPAFATTPPPPDPPPPSTPGVPASTSAASGTSPPALPPDVPPDPLCYTNVLGNGRTQSHEKLRPSSEVFASCSFDKSSLKTPVFSKEDLVKLIDCRADDYDTWLTNHIEVKERLLKYYYQRYFSKRPKADVAAGVAVSPSAAARAALEDCRDLFRDSIALATNLSRVHARTKKSRSADPDKDLLLMMHSIDSHAVPKGSVSIVVDIQKRCLRLGEESIATFLEELINMCSGHVSSDDVRTRFIVGVTLAMDEAEKSGAYNLLHIDYVRDNVLSSDARLPASNDELREKLENMSATSRVWKSVLQPGPTRGAKEARTQMGVPVPLEQQFQEQASVQTHGASSGGMQVPAQSHAPSAPPSVPAPQQVAGYASQEHSAHANFGSPQGHEQHEQQNLQTASANYGGAQGGYQKGGYQQQQGGYQQYRQGYQQQQSYGPQGGGYQQQQGYGYQRFSAPNGGRGGMDGGDGGGKGKGKGKGGPKDPNAPTRFYDYPAIIKTGLIWPVDTKLYWNNPATINPDGSGTGLYCADCPLCGKNKKHGFTYDEYIAKYGKPPGTGPGKHPQPVDVAVDHRGLNCHEAGWDVLKYVRDHPDAPSCMKEYMTEGALAHFKTLVG